MVYAYNFTLSRWTRHLLCFLLVNLFAGVAHPPPVEAGIFRAIGRGIAGVGRALGRVGRGIARGIGRVGRGIGRLAVGGARLVGRAVTGRRRGRF
jgi:hypothetical protein